eukprot:gene23693-biopygen20840
MGLVGPVRPVAPVHRSHRSARTHRGDLQKVQVPGIGPTARNPDIGVNAVIFDGNGLSVHFSCGSLLLQRLLGGGVRGVTRHCDARQAAGIPEETGLWIDQERVQVQRRRSELCGNKATIATSPAAAAAAAMPPPPLAAAFARVVEQGNTADDARHTHAERVLGVM